MRLGEAVIYILGLNCGSAASHDSSACLVDDQGTVLAFLEEERLTRVRHAPGALPVHAIAKCLEIAGVAPQEVDIVAIGWDEPRLCARRGQPWEFDTFRELLMQLGIGNTTRIPDVYFVPHHRAHAASAFYSSPYSAAAVLVVDGNGEDESVSIFRARRGAPLIRLASWPRVYSIGYLYEVVSDWLGFGRLGAGKTMGLAAYARTEGGNPGWLSVDSGHLVSELGSNSLLDYDDLTKMWRTRMEEFTGASRAVTQAAYLDRDVEAVQIAWAAQTTVESVMTWLAAQARAMIGCQELCIAGGVALNCAANGRLEPPVYVPPIPHDAGVALGAAWSVVAPQDQKVLSAYTGGLPGPLPAEVDSAADREPLEPDRVAGLLANGEVVAVCRGRSEVGPRALCHRSLLASPTKGEMRDTMNNLKRREPWRPFGPVTNADHDLWSPVGELERYMVGAAYLTDRGIEEIPAVRHVDGTTRPQRLRPAEECFVDSVLRHLNKGGHLPVLINTSFNGPGEPLVETAVDAVNCALRLGVKFLIIEDDLIRF